MDDKITTNGDAESNMANPVRGAASNGGTEIKKTEGDLPAEASAQAGGSNTPAPQGAPQLQTHSETSGIPEHEELLSEHFEAPAPRPAQPEAVHVPAPSSPVPTTPIIEAVPPKPAVPTPPTPAAPPAPAQTPPIPQGPFQDDISKILKEIKLPERHDLPAQEGVARPASPKIFKPTPIPPPAKPDMPEAVIISETTIPNPNKPPAPVAPKETPATGVEKPIAEKKPELGSTEAPEEEGFSIVSPLRTLKEDLQHVIRDRKISLVRAVALEQDKKRETHQATPAELAAQRQRRRRLFAVLFASGVLFFLGAAALIGVYTIQNEHTAQVAAFNDSSLLFAESAVTLPIENQSSGDLKRILAQARGISNATLGSITRIVPTEPVSVDSKQTRPATTAEFFASLGTHAPPDLIRAFGDQFFLGIHTVDKNAPVIVIQITSYDHAFAGMLAWEATMNQDLTPIFTPVPPLVAGENGLPANRIFKDAVMRNYDVRALKDDAGIIELYYSFPTPNILVIAESPYTFTEVLSRLQAERKL